MHRAVKHAERNSHAAHLSNQIHHDVMQNVQNQVINASVSQQVAAQALASQTSAAAVSWNNPGSNPAMSGMPPGMGFGY